MDGRGETRCYKENGRGPVRRAVFAFKLVAPPYSGTVRLFGAGNSCNGNGGSSGDRAGLTTFSVSVTGGTTAPRRTSWA